MLARAGELRKSASEVRNMSTNKEYTFHISTGDDPETLPTTDSYHINIKYDGSGGSLFHELRHGNQAMTGELNFKFENNKWSGGNSYGVNDEVSAYRAQYAYDGSLSLPLVGMLPPANAYGVNNPNLTQINRMSDITPNLINSIAIGSYNENRRHPRYPIHSKGWNNN